MLKEYLHHWKNNTIVKLSSTSQWQIQDFLKGVSVIWRIEEEKGLVTLGKKLDPFDDPWRNLCVPIRS